MGFLSLISSWSDVIFYPSVQFLVLSIFTLIHVMMSTIY